MERTVHVDLKKLPSFSGLAAKVQEVLRTSSVWEVYGWEWLGALIALACLPLGLLLLGSQATALQVLGMFVLGLYHTWVSTKLGHQAAHGALSPYRPFNEFLTKLCVEFVGSFSSWSAHDIHIKIHHPHTNIIGLGDSSTWKVSSLSRFPYMFFMPLIVPLVTPIIALLLLVQDRQWRQLAGFVVIMPAGLAMHIYLLMSACGYSLLGAFVCLFTFRAVLSIPYIHLNIFQHIGLPMYHQKSRPARLYQMSTGSLNLSRNWLLDLAFGHTLINCHVEHHLFPRLGDNMCLKVKPIVSQYLKENGLPYNEDSYWNRLLIFLQDYDSLMVKAPPITHFVGIQ